MEQWQLVGLITRRSGVRIPLPLPSKVVPGGQSEVAPPVPIPNTEVKRLSADDTAPATGCGK